VGSMSSFRRFLRSSSSLIASLSSFMRSNIEGGFEGIVYVTVYAVLLKIGFMNYNYVSGLSCSFVD
jgi:hypothetical protein